MDKNKHFMAMINVSAYTWLTLSVYPYNINIKLNYNTTKSTKRPECQVKTQISLGTCPIWSESSLTAWRKLGSLATHWAHTEDSDQTWRMSRLIWVFAGGIYHCTCFVMHRLQNFRYCRAVDCDRWRTAFQPTFLIGICVMWQTWQYNNCISVSNIFFSVKSKS